MSCSHEELDNLFASFQESDSEAGTESVSEHDDAAQAPDELEGVQQPQANIIEPDDNDDVPLYQCAFCRIWFHPMHHVHVCRQDRLDNNNCTENNNNSNQPPLPEYRAEPPSLSSLPDDPRWLLRSPGPSAEATVMAGLRDETRTHLNLMARERLCAESNREIVSAALRMADEDRFSWLRHMEQDLESDTDDSDSESCSSMPEAVEDSDSDSDSESVPGLVDNSDSDSESESDPDEDANDGAGAPDDDADDGDDNGGGHAGLAKPPASADAKPKHRAQDSDRRNANPPQPGPGGAAAAAKKHHGRSGNANMKMANFTRPLMEVLGELCTLCKEDSCHIPGNNCTSTCSLPALKDLRTMYYRAPGQPPPTDRERAQLVVDLLRKAERQGNKFTFTVEGRKVCLVGYLRLLGVMVSALHHYIIINTMFFDNRFFFFFLF